MATQAMLIADTLAGMKKAISRDQSYSDSDESLPRPTNRGNKLKRKYQHIHEGQLDLSIGPRSYKRRIDYAGYQRQIISRNPKLFDDDGDEVEQDEVDEQVHAEARARNPYGEVILENLLAPLTSAAELSMHPSLSTPYCSQILADMVKESCRVVQKEKKTLNELKRLMTIFRGDVGWIPCGDLQSDNDSIIFGSNELRAAMLETGCLQDCLQSGFEGRSRTQGYSQQRAAGTEACIDNLTARQDLQKSVSPQANDRFITSSDAKVPFPVDSKLMNVNDRLAPIADASRSQGLDGTSTAPVLVSHAFTSNGFQGGSSKNFTIPIDQPQAIVMMEISAAEDDTLQQDSLSKDTSSGPTGGENLQSTKDGMDIRNVEIDDDDPKMEEENPINLFDGGEGSRTVSHRMTTRAKAQAVSDKTASLPTRSPSSETSSGPYFIHPLFLVPPSAQPDRDFGLPDDEAEETRRILMSYIQKQEEVCHGAAKLYEGLLQADRMRKTVLKWCKAEAHRGEASDGEDWYDKEEWGLDEDLRKGAEEDEEEAGNQSKKTRNRRAQ